MRIPKVNDGMTRPSEGTAATHRQTAIAAAGLVASLFMYVIVVEVLTRSPSEPAIPAFFASLRIALFVVAGVAIFTSTIVKALLLRNPPAGVAERAARMRTATLVALAMAEIPVLCGLVLVLLGRARADFYLLLAISVYMMVRHFPRRGPWDEYVSRGGSDAVR